MEAYKVFSANNLKVIAAVVMFLDHFATVFMPHNALLSLALRFFGRLAAPIFCFFVAQGFHYTSNRKKYIARLLVLAAVSHMPYNLAFGLTFFQATSVVWPLAMGLVALAAIKNEKIHWFFKLAVFGLCCILSWTANWNFVAVFWVVSFGLFHGNFKRQALGFCAIGAALHLAPAFLRFGFFHPVFPQWFQLGIFLALPLLAMFSGKVSAQKQPAKKSAFMTWFFYVFYPAHLLFLFLLNRFTPLGQAMSAFFP
ncbi:MAG: conjugal transfer protein TraX [Spirochaetes bacterium]|nr:conjugal transfer protein TraX [Spirochaetota bacterium]